MKKKRGALLKEWDVATKHVVSVADLANMERQLASLEQTYTIPATLLPRLALTEPYIALVRSSYILGEPMKHITTAWKALASLGFTIRRDTSSVISPFEVEQWGLVVDPVIRIWLLLWIAYARLLPRQPELSKKLEEYTRTTYKICTGEDETFEQNVLREARMYIQGLGDLDMASMTV